MIQERLNLPDSAFVNKYVAKNKFYEKAAVSSRLQKTFVNKIHRITWKYKLAEDTINLSPTENVNEIQIFEIELKSQEIPKNALKIIDKAIPYQILYHFVFSDNEAWGITLKESGKTEAWYFSNWNETINFDFSGLNLEAVYQKLVKSFIREEAKTSDDFDEQVAIDQKIKILEKEIQRLENKIRKEKQMNRKVEINKKRLELKDRLNKIKKQ